MHKIYRYTFNMIVINKNSGGFVVEALTHSSLSLRFHVFLSFSDVEGGHVLGGGDEVHKADAGLHQADSPAESLQPVEPGCRFLDVVEKVKQTEEELVPGAHHKQHRLGCVVDSEDRVAGEVDGLVTG